MQQQRQGTNSGGAFAAVTTLFFAWGFITSLIDPLVAAVKGIFSLSDMQAQLSASAFFIAYGVMSFPAAMLLARRNMDRTPWFAGAGLLGVVVLKLLLVDMSSAEGWQRIVAFIAVGVLMLLVGYLVPLPPKDEEAQA